MKRTWLVRPDEELGYVTDDQMVESLFEAAALLKRAGGVLSVVTQREPTDFPGEMVTTAAVFEWKDRTDARPQPEATQRVVEQEPEPDGVHDFDGLVHPDDIADGLDESALPDEDLDSVAASAR